MNLDLRQYNGGARKGAGLPKSIDGYRQVSVRLPADMARWVLQQSMKTCGGCEAELLRSLVRRAMEQDMATSEAANAKDKEVEKATDSKG